MLKATKRGWRCVALGMLLLPGLAGLESSIYAQGQASTGKQATSTSTGGVSARQLMKQARAAFDQGDYAKARQFTEQAQASKSPPQFWDESPDALLAEIDRKQGKTTKTVKRPAPSSDPRVLIQMGRTALEAGKIDEAQDLARQAEAQARGTRFGLFEDTPSSLLSAVQKAKAQKDRSEADRLLVEARKLYEQPAKESSDRLTNLDKAQAMAFKADKLHGPYSMWDLGDRPTRLIGEIESNRAKLRLSSRGDAMAAKTTPNKMTTPMTTPKAKDPETVKTVQYTPPEPMPTPSSGMGSTPGLSSVGTASMPTTSVTAEKTNAIALMGEAKQLMAQGKVGPSKAKLVEAQSLNASFSVQEESPGALLQALIASGHQEIQARVREAQMLAVKANRTPAEVANADAKLTLVAQLAGELGLDTTPIADARARLNLPATPTNSMPVVSQTPTMTPPSTTMPSTTTASNAGSDLLQKARLELRRGDTEMARRMCIEAMSGPYGVQEDGQTLLRSIEAEEFTQRKTTSNRNFDAGFLAFRNRNYRESANIFAQIDPALLTADKQTAYKDMYAHAVKEVQASNPSGVQSADLVATPGLNNVTPVSAQGTPMGVIQTTPMSPMARSGANNLAAQVQAMQEVQFQALRTEGLQVQSEATKKFGRGETDESITMMKAYVEKVKTSQIDPSRIALLTRPIEFRLDNFKQLKRQKDFFTQESNDLKDTRTRMTSTALNEQNKKEEVSRLMKQYHAQFDQGKYREAQMTAMKAHDMDPDDPATQAAMQIAKVQLAQSNWDGIKARKEAHVLEDLNDANEMGPVVSGKDPLKIDPELMRRNRDRAAYRDGFSLKSLNDKERIIELKLNKPVTVDFKEAPLGQVIDDLRIMSGMNIVPDLAAMNEQQINLDKRVSLKVDNVAMKSVLNLVLKQVHLTHVVEDDVLKITTEKHAKGKLIQRVFSVADLVIPIDNYATPDTMNLHKVLESQMTPRFIQQGTGSQLSGSLPVGNVTMGAVPPGQGNQLVNEMHNELNAPSPMAASAYVVRNKNTMEDRLMKLVTSTIKPLTWSDVGGAGTIEYYPIGLALVVNQTGDVIQEVADLLEALRRLQDLEVSVEVRLIALSESFFERIGLDFSVNIKTDSNTANFEPQLTTQQFAPAPFINDIRTRGVTTGLTPAGSFTNDLDIPIRSSSFNYAIPPFGGYPNIPGGNGGLSLGLAFLNDIQVFMFMEAAQGDRRINVMQAPKVTLVNGQTSTINVTDQTFFVANVQVFSVNGQIVFVPNNTPFPTGLNLAVQASVSADRRFVRLNLPVTLTNLASTIVPLFPITTFVTPVFEGGSQGQPIPFTQFLQQPTFQTITINTTVIVPDGGTVLLGGLKTLSEGRNEFGPPVLSKVPYVNRLFKNVGYGRETQSLMLMVTPRIIINSEEETRQTGFDGSAQGQP